MIACIVVVSNGSLIVVQVYDKDVGGDDYLGEAQVKLNIVAEGVADWPIIKGLGTLRIAFRFVNNTLPT
jgi:hypothetical protein